MSGTGAGNVKVVYLGHTAAMSGGEIGLLRLIEAPTDISAHVILAEDGPLVAALERAGATVEVLELNPEVRHVRREDLAGADAALRAAGSVLAYANRTARRLRRLEPDIVHTNTLKAGVYGVVAARMARLPVIWGLHDRLAPDYLPARAVAPMRALVKTAPTALIVPSQATLDAVGRGFRPGLKRAVIPLPVPAPEIDYVVRESVTCVGLVGRLAPWKGQDVFLRAFARAFPTGETRARIVGSALFGEDSYADRLTTLAGELGIAERVDFTGFRSDIPAELAQMDILINSSVLPETLGQTIIEAMGAGVPTIAPRAGGPAEYVTDGISGLLHEPGNVTALAAALARLSNDVALRDRLSAGGRSAVERFGPAHAAERLVRFYAEVQDI